MRRHCDPFEPAGKPARVTSGLESRRRGRHAASARLLVVSASIVAACAGLSLATMPVAYAQSFTGDTVNFAEYFTSTGAFFYSFGNGVAPTTINSTYVSATIGTNTITITQNSTAGVTNLSERITDLTKSQIASATLVAATGGFVGTTITTTPSYVNFALPDGELYAGNMISVLVQFSLALNAPLSAFAQTQNQRAVASGLTVAFNAANLGTTAAPTGAAGAIVTAFNATNPAAIPGILDSLSGEGIAATQNLAHRESGMFTSAIFDQIALYGAGGGASSGNQIVLTAPQPGPGFQALAPRSGSSGTVAPGDTLSAAALGLPVRELADLPRPYIAPVAVAPTRTWRAWGTGFGANEDIHSNAAIGYAAQSNQIYGGAVGVDYQIAPGTLLGLAAGGSDGQFAVPNRATSGSTTGGHIAGYSLASFGPAYGAASVSGSFYQNRTTRNVGGFGGLGSETEKGSFSSREVRVRLEAGRGFASPFGGLLGGATITPFVAMEIASLRSDGFTEQGIAGPGLFVLNVAGQSAADAPAFVGLRFAGTTTLGNGMVFKPVLQLAYEHEFAPYRQLSAGIASLPGATFLIDGARPARDAAQVKAGGELAIGPRTAIYANFDGEFAKANQLYGGKGGLKIAF